MTRVLIADDHPIIISGLESLLAETSYAIVATEADGDAALAAAEKSDAEILILDVQMPGMNGVDILQALRGRGDRRPVVLLTARLGDERLLKAIEYGVAGIVLKEQAASELIRCLDEVRNGGRWIDRELLIRALEIQAKASASDRKPLAALSSRELAISQRVARGMRNREVAGELGITEGTVKVYLHRIYDKLGVTNRTELALVVRESVDE